MFDDEFVARLVQRYEHRPVWEHPELLLVAAAPERAPQRAWMRAELNAIPEPGRSRLTARLHRERGFTAAYHELCVAGILRDAGLVSEFEVDLEGVTPDLLIRSDPALVIEVWTRNRPDPTKKSNRAWQVLASRISNIPVPVGLFIMEPSSGDVLPPDSSTAKQIGQALKDWLLRVPRKVGDSVWACGYNFQIIFLLPGLTARLAIPARGGWIDSDVIVGAISEKVARYHRTVENIGAAFLVVMAGESQSTLTLESLQTALAGKQSISFSFSPGQPGIVFQHAVQLRVRDKPENFNSALSAVALLEPGITGPGNLTILPAQSASRPMPQLSGPRIRIERT